MYTRFRLLLGDQVGCCRFVRPIKKHTHTSCLSPCISLFAMFSFPLALVFWVFLGHRFSSPVY